MEQVIVHYDRRGREAAVETTNITTITKNHIPKPQAEQLLNSFLVGGKSNIPRNKRQKKVKNHERLD